MGLALWLASALAALGLARLVPSGRDAGWIRELVTSLAAAAALGVIATALDFGGWREPDWRAGLFVLLGALAAIGTVRAFRSPASRSRPGPPRPGR